MVATPLETPVTLPEPSTDATPALVVVQAPPVAASVKDIIVPMHKDEGPEIEPALGNGFTVKLVVVNAVAHAVVTV